MVQRDSKAETGGAPLIALGEPLSLPECDHGLAGEVVETCVWEDRVRIAAAERPTHLRFDHVEVVLDAAGRIQEVSASLDPEYAKHVRDLLEIEYGKPDYVFESMRDSSLWSWTY
jgi:hypothetical protein